mgnify:CR=1 FL=1
MANLKTLLSNYPVEKYPWCTVLRAIENNHSQLQSLLSTTRNISSLELCQIDADSLAEVTSSQLIDRFLKVDDHRIVAPVGDCEEDETVVTEATFDDEDDLDEYKEDCEEYIKRIRSVHKEKNFFMDKIEYVINSL